MEVCEGSDIVDIVDWRQLVVMGNTLHEVTWLLMVDFTGCGKTDLETSKELLTAFAVGEGRDDDVCKHTSNFAREF